MSANSTTTPRALGAFLAELLGWARGSAAQFRRQRQFASATRLEVAGDIAADAIKASNQLAADAHRAETYDREAERLIEQAQRPDSDGGATITPAEAKPIRAFVHRSAEADHDIAERAPVPAA